MIKYPDYKDPAKGVFNNMHSHFEILRLGTATGPLRRRTKKRKTSMEKMVATELLKLAMETEEGRKEKLKKMVANHSAEASP